MTERALEVEVLGPDGAVLRSPGASGRRRGAWIAVAALAAVALAGAVAFAVSRLDASSGPQSPEAAVDELLGALASGDLAGAVDSLRAAERESLGDPLLEIADELVRLEVLAPDIDLGAVTGISVTFDDPEYDVEEVTDDLAVVRTTGGAVTTTVDLDGLPLGDAVAERLAGFPLPEGPLERTVPLGGTELAVVREDGSWRVSLWYTVAERARDAGSDPPGGPLVEAVGADSPEAVVSDLLRAVEAVDPAAALALVDPVEAAPLHTYASLFLAGAVDGAASARDDLALDVEVGAPELEVEQDGPVARVVVADPEQLSVEASWSDPTTGPGSLSFDGTCLAISEGGAPPLRTCPGSDADAGLLPVPGLATSLAGLGGGERSIVAVERDGRWYLSPGRTITGSVLASLAALEPADVAVLFAGLELLAAMPVEDATGDGEAPEVVPGGRDVPAPDGVPLDDPRVAAVTEGLPTGLDGVAGDGSFDDAYVQRFEDGTRLTVTRVFRLRAGFADIIVAEGADMPALGEPVVVAGHDASVDRYGDGVVLTGTAGGFGVQVSVFGLDRGLDPEAAALELYAATAAHLTGS